MAGLLGIILLALTIAVQAAPASASYVCDATNRVTTYAKTGVFIRWAPRRWRDVRPADA